VDEPLRVPFLVNGQAGPNDYAPLEPNEVLIPAGAHSTKLSFVAIRDY